MSSPGRAINDLEMNGMSLQTHPCILHTHEKPPESSTVMQIMLKYLKVEGYKHYLTRQKFSTHKYEQNKTITNFLVQILMILSHSEIGPNISP